MTRQKWVATAACLLLGLVPTPAADIPELVRRVKPAIVELFTFDSQGRPLASGSGFFASSMGVVITNWHVIDGATEVLARTLNGQIYHYTGIRKKVGDLDVAALGFQAKNVPYLEVDPDAEVVEGQRILVIGSPEGLEGTVSDGLVSAIRANGELIQITAPVSHGSSGSPVLNDDGKVIGVATIVFREGQNLNFAISARAIAEVVNASLARHPGPAKETAPSAISP